MCLFLIWDVDEYAITFTISYRDIKTKNVRQHEKTYIYIGRLLFCFAVSGR